ncbi:hypothetical protein [Hathewaya limosa]|uniref:Uncharacterized protein n=1 Tax=Hathewaya limosa TaxID=1536 RepID=A0ABU0JS37_HATLI|nr:hypothetical protein [Hathewaya limosa]AWZ48804.1 hypothetical protein C3495_08285 [Clostridiaceae bacterium 14S0207]MDQ0478899.1 hypothetical protein [Hathewaya limosa]
MLKKKYKLITIVMVLVIFFTGFLTVNKEITKTLGENNLAPIKVYYIDSPFNLKIELKKYRIEISKNALRNVFAKIHKTFE